MLNRITKSSFVLAILIAFNHLYPATSHANIVLVGGCFLASLKVWNVIRSRSADPFVSLQNFSWLILTTFSVEHPDRESDYDAAERTDKEDATKTEDKVKND